MKIFILNLFLILFLNSVKSAELKIESFGKDQYDIYEVSDSRKFFGWSSDGVWLTNIGINGSVTGKGILEIINGISSSNIMTFFNLFFLQYSRALTWLLAHPI